ncbi:hypothetical protein [Streptomyces liangshanensis]|uniref:Uncharacterized protein n=1 Tax=Streptomyces liangshanensis TaxID=2717324 RepID=A0A6G9GZP8_9ACTN|nr:hypothetical protein [Streptomyces liangshanensis]QIQ03546.1 hypothetical protein HA039_15520 [Streptomyces liangshanensis]
MAVPERLRGRPVRIEAWGWIGSLGFEVVGVTEPQGRYTENDAGSSGIGREKSHILLVPGQCESVRIKRGWKMSGRWKIRFADAMPAEPLPPKAKGATSRLFRCPAPGTRLAVEFGDSGGRLTVYNEEGRRIATLAGREHQFNDAVVIPKVKGLLAVESTVAKWGPMTHWSLRTEPTTATS